MNSLKAKRLLLSLLFFFSAVIIPITLPSKVFAQPAQCNPRKPIYNANEKNSPLDIGRTADNLLTAAVVDSAFSKVAGGSPERVIGCIKRGVTQSGATDPTLLALVDNIVGDCDVSDENFCDALNNTFAAPQTSAFTKETLQQLTNSESSYHHAAGSLVGLGNKLQNAANEPVPLTYAYFFNRQVEKIPFVNTAYAQSDAVYSGPFLEVTYDIWVIFRNAAFGIMAVIMIVVGILIMTRKKINPQTAVTVQYAVPRIVIALILIAFSYIIGATLASFAWALRHSGDNIIWTLGNFTTAELSAAIDLATGSVVTIFFLGLSLVMMGGIGTVIVALSLLVIVVTLIMWILVQIKLLFVYIKFLIEIVTAPITFARGAIPGQENATTDWFKKVIAYTCGLFGANLAIGITNLVAAAIVVSAAGSLTPGGFVLAAFLGPYITFFILIYGYNYARKVPDKIEAAIVGDKKKGR